MTCGPLFTWSSMTCDPLLPCYPATTTRVFQRAVSQGELMNISSPPTQSVLSDFLIVRDERKGTVSLILSIKILLVMFLVIFFYLGTRMTVLGL